MSEDLKHLDEHIRACMVVFGCLLVLTAITVAVSYLDVSHAATVTIALCVASVKGAMVLMYFMHLVSEKKLILWSLALTTFFFVSMIILIVSSDADPIRILIERSV